MNGATVIKGNKAAGNGGGVWIGGVTTSFNKTGGVIYGDSDIEHTPGEDENTVTATGKKGHAIYQGESYYRNVDAIATDNITASNVSGSEAHAGLSATGQGPF
jgi:hypothetical protein